MIDAILTALVLALFAAGFWCGRCFPSWAALVARMKRVFRK